MTTAHVDCAAVARLVSAEIAAIEQSFARRVADTLTEMRPSTDHPADRDFTSGVEMAIRTVLALAGVPAERRTDPNDGERPGTFLNGPEQALAAVDR
ncbi:hypothetical protein ABT340_41385 [Streptosporangium sp. NPDC000239]|uniref:hypothetical protein n=1 Tax=Streptosporangium sp. NPDC000239 TaxID=3154248 RepID=UPI0033223097